MPVIKINNLNKVFGDNEVLKDINLEINQGGSSSNNRSIW